MPSFNLFQYVPKSQRQAGFTVPPATPAQPFNPTTDTPGFGPGTPAFQAAFQPPSQSARAVAGSGVPSQAIESLVGQGMNQAQAIEALLSVLMGLRR